MHTRILHLAVCLVSLLYLVLFVQHPSFALAWCLLCLQLTGIQLALKNQTGYRDKKTGQSAGTLV